MKPWLAGLLLNLAVVALFLLHLWPHLQVLFSDPLFEEIDYLIDPDPEPHDSDSLEDDTPVESGAFVLQREAELAEAEEHSLGTWKGPKHREMWTPGPLLGAALVVLVLFLNSAAPYAIRCYELQRQEDAKAWKHCLALALALCSWRLLGCAYAGRGISPLKADIEVLGVLRGRLVVGFHPQLEAVHVYANKTRLKPLKDNKWREQDRRYGERDCRYAEFAIPPLPASIQVIGRAIGGKPVRNATHFLPEDNVPTAAQWNEQFMRPKAAPRLQGKRMVKGLQDSGWK
ncbi:unnamed protein product [Effrenium voratum]|nr:unnamed protein product [Effrenium voratum]